MADLALLVVPLEKVIRLLRSAANAAALPALPELGMNSTTSVGGWMMLIISERRRKAKKDGLEEIISNFVGGIKRK